MIDCYIRKVMMLLVKDLVVYVSSLICYNVKMILCCGEYWFRVIFYGGFVGCID